MPFLEEMPCCSPTDYQNLAQLATINFVDLLDGNGHELSNLREACETYGFFYLNLSGAGSGKLTRDLKTLEGIMRNWFDQPLDVKMQTENISLAHGYKPTGVQSGVTNGSKDGFEALKIGRNELVAHWALPPVVENNQAVFDTFSATTHYILKTILECLSNSIGLKGSSSLSHYQRDDVPSKSTLYFLHYPATSISQNEIGQNMHTDIGLLTLLFAPQWGLQVLSPSTKEWQLVEPKPGHAIINVGDSLRFLSKGRFRSALHRAMPIEGVDRMSTSYFLRVNDGVEFSDSDGVGTDAKSWYLRKYDMYEQVHEVQEKESVLTGGMAKELEK